MLPSHCPACKTSLKWTVNKKGKKTDLYCPNTNCSGPKKRQIEHFFRILSADAIQLKTIEAMLEAGFKDIPDILQATPKQLAKIPGFKDKKIANHLLSMKKLATSMSLAKLAHASGLFSNQSTGIGSTLLEPIISALGRKVVLEAPINDKQLKLKLLELPNIGVERAEIFVNKLPEFREFFKSLKNITLAAENKQGKLSGKVFAFTSFRDAKMQLLIEQNGGRISNTVSKNVNVLFAAAPSSKTAKAENYGITIVTKDKAKSYLKNLLN